MHNAMAKNSDDNTSFVRVRKPPGGDSSDIFNLNTSINKWSQSKENLTDFEKIVVNENMKGYKRDSSRRNSPKVSEFDQENITAATNPGDDLAEDKPGDGEFKDMPDGNLEEEFTEISLEDDKEEPKSQKFVCHNPITGEMTKMEVKGARPKLRDCSNKMRRPSINSDETANLGLSRPSIRIRQPPGGVSSNIFPF